MLHRRDSRKRILDDQYQNDPMLHIG